MTIRSYRRMAIFETFSERFEYLKLSGRVGFDTFGFDRYLNQGFYRSREWRQMRHEVISRDLGCDLGVEGMEIHDRIYIHHMNPMTKDQLVHGDAAILDPEYLICCTLATHNAIHYGDELSLPLPPAERRPNDTIPWRR